MLLALLITATRVGLVMKTYWGLVKAQLAEWVILNTRGPMFESSHKQFLLSIYLLLTVKKRIFGQKYYDQRLQQNFVLLVAKLLLCTL